jgi:hypothetical protein
VQPSVIVECVENVGVIANFGIFPTLWGSLK